MDLTINLRAPLCTEDAFTHEAMAGFGHDLSGVSLRYSFWVRILVALYAEPQRYRQNPERFVRLTKRVGGILVAQPRMMEDAGSIFAKGT